MGQCLATETEHEETAASGGRWKEAVPQLLDLLEKKCSQPVLAGYVSVTGPEPVTDIALVDFQLSENLYVWKLSYLGLCSFLLCCS